MEKNICVAGFGGQGVMSLGKFISQSVCNSTDKFVTFFPSYGAEQRGGTANCFVVMSDEPIGAPIGNKLDDLIVMNAPSLNKFIKQLKPGGTLFVNSTIVKEVPKLKDISIVEAPVTELAIRIGNEKTLNVIMLGVYIGYTEAIPEDIIWQTVSEKLKNKTKLIELNRQAFNMGLEIGKNRKKSN